MSNPELPEASTIESVLHEQRVFPPAKSFAAAAHIKSMEQYRQMYQESIRRPDRFWARQAKSELVWFKPWKQVMHWKEPFVRWFDGGVLNAAYNCLDRHLETPVANKAAIIWEGEPDSISKPGEERVLTYKQLHREVCRFANVLKRNGVKKGDRVIIYLPMVPEAAIAMLACARIGAIHSVVFGGFSAHSVADRIHDCAARVVITADGGFRRGMIVQLKKNVDEALKLTDDQGRLLGRSVEKYGVTILYTAPTAIRSFMKWGEAWPGKHDLSSLRLLGTVGELINPEAWIWYHEVIGGKRCPIVDTWWQTETGCIMIRPQ